MKNKTSILAISLLIALFFCDSTALAFRCGRKIVTLGDTTLEVLNKCGDPTSREVVRTEVRGGYLGLTDETEEDLSVERRYYKEVYVKVERWHYDFGPHKFMKILTFRGGVLTRIKRVGYGTVGTGASGSKASESGNLQEPATPRNFGSISLLGTPYGARVYVDGNYVGNIPCTLEQMQAGVHNLLVTNEGYKDWAERVVVTKERTLALDVYLEREKVDRPKNEQPADAKSNSDPPRKVYKWTDEKGHVHITDRPPPGSSK